MTHSETPAPGAPSMAVRRRQIAAILSIELGKTYLRFRALPLYVLAALPVLPYLLRFLVHMVWGTEEMELAHETRVFAWLYQTFMLGAIYFGAVVTFVNLFRGEVLDRTFHLYLLAPVHRTVLAIGKFASGLLTTVVLFGSSTVLAYLLAYLPMGGAALGRWFGDGAGWSHLTSYLTVTVLACIGYGAVFLTAGLLFRNPFIPAVVMLGWESLHFVLPATLKKLSVYHYLLGSMPTVLPEGPFAIVTDYPSGWTSAFAVLLLTAIGLTVTGLKLRQVEIAYGSD